MTEYAFFVCESNQIDHIKKQDLASFIPMIPGGGKKVDKF